MITAGDNPERLRSESSSAMLCGVAPRPASSGLTTRRRLNKGGGRAASSAIRIVAVGRLGADGRTRAYAARKMSGGHSEPEAIRCVKRCIARELYYDIIARNRMLKTA